MANRTGEDKIEGLELHKLTTNNSKNDYTMMYDSPIDSCCQHVW